MMTPTNNEPYEPHQKKNKKSLFFLKLSLVIILLAAIVLIIRPLAQWAKENSPEIVKNTVKIISSTAGTSMQLDENGNVNVLLMGYGGAQHAGGFLTDTIIIASWNPKRNVVSMISFPRDLFVNNTFGGQSRINTIFTQIYGKEKDLAVAAKGFIQEMEKISGLKIPYYATIDFSGFEKLIDSLWGIEIDVPHTIHDTLYPNNNLGYETFYLAEGVQQLDGATALKYARSRHSTSDFSRSLRQQLIIEAIKNKILWERLSINKVKELYEFYTQIVNTNVSLDEMLWTIQYLDKIKMSSLGLNTMCNYKNFKNTDPGCFLYNPSRELFGGAAIILPIWANPNKIDFYDYIHNFINFIVKEQSALAAQASIKISNGVDNNLAGNYGQKNVPLAGNLAVKMKKFWLNVVETANVENQAASILIVNAEEGENFESSIQAIERFLTLDEIIYSTGVQKTLVDEYGNEIEIFTGTDLELILWNTYLDYLSGHKFSMEVVQ